MSRHPTVSHPSRAARARVGAIALVACAAIASTAPAARGDETTVKKGTAVTIESHLELKAAPAKVWAALTSMEGLCALTGYTVAGPMRQRSIAKIGETMLAQTWGETGRIYVTGFHPESELRVTWEPASGAYLCGQRITLAPTPNGGTALAVSERYTDDTPNADETAAKAREATAKGLEAFRAIAEK